jgi:hypothetical protein
MLPASLQKISKGRPIAGEMLDVLLLGPSPPAPTPSPYNTSTRIFPEGPLVGHLLSPKKFLSSEQADFVAHKVIEKGTREAPEVS